MRITIQIEDELADKYQARGREGQPLEQILVIQLKRFADYDPKERLVVIPTSARTQIEELTNRMPLVYADDLVKRIAALAELSIGRIRFRWTPHQYRELKALAEKWRMPVASYAEKIVREIEAQFFSYNPKESNAPILVETVPESTLDPEAAAKGGSRASQP